MFFFGCINMSCEVIYFKCLFTICFMALNYSTETPQIHCRWFTKSVSIPSFVKCPTYNILWSKFFKTFLFESWTHNITIKNSLCCMPNVAQNLQYWSGSLLWPYRPYGTFATRNTVQHRLGFDCRSRVCRLSPVGGHWLVLLFTCGIGATGVSADEKEW